MFPPDRVAAMRARLQQVADGFGVPIAHHDHAPSTKAALALSEYARRKGKLAEWRAGGMDAYWRDGRDLEDPDVLRELAEGAGLDPDEALAFLDDPEVPALLQAQRVEARRWGVTGIPTWFLLPAGWTPDGAEWPEDGPQPVRVVGCQPYELVERAARMAGATPRS